MTVGADGNFNFLPRPSPVPSIPPTLARGTLAKSSNPKAEQTCTFRGPEGAFLSGKWPLTVETGLCSAKKPRGLAVAEFLMDPWAEVSVINNREQAAVFEIQGDRCLRLTIFSAVCLAGAAESPGTRVINRPWTAPPREFAPDSHPSNRYYVGTNGSSYVLSLDPARSVWEEYQSSMTVRLYPRNSNGELIPSGNQNPATRCEAPVRGAEWVYNNGGIGEATGTTWRSTVSDLDVCRIAATMAREVTSGFGPGTAAIYAKTINGWGCFYSRKPQLTREGPYLVTCSKRKELSRHLQWFTLRQNFEDQELDRSILARGSFASFLASNPRHVSYVDCGRVRVPKRLWEFTQSGARQTGDQWFVYARGLPCELVLVLVDGAVAKALGKTTMDTIQGKVLCTKSVDAFRPSLQQSICRLNPAFSGLEGAFEFGVGPFADLLSEEMSSSASQTPGGSVRE